MKSRKFNLNLVRCSIKEQTEHYETKLQFYWRHVRNLWLQIKKQYWNL